MVAVKVMAPLRSSPVIVSGRVVAVATVPKLMALPLKVAIQPDPRGGL